MTPSKGKARTSNNGGRKSKQGSTPKDAAPKINMPPEEEISEMVDGTPTRPASQTPKKRRAHSLGSDIDENGTPTKVVKTEFKEEDY